MVLLDVVCLTLKIKALLKIAMIVPMEATTRETAQLQRYYTICNTSTFATLIYCP
jgi:hypothetical protein